MGTIMGMSVICCMVDKMGRQVVMSVICWVDNVGYDCNLFWAVNCGDNDFRKKLGGRGVLSTFKAICLKPFV